MAEHQRRGLWWKIPLASIGGLLLVVFLAVAVALSDWGLERVRRLALPRINDQIQGRIEIAQIQRKGMQLWLRGVRVHDPEGRTAAFVPQVHVHVGLRPLLSGNVVVHDLTLHNPELQLVTEKRGLNLARALEPKDPQPTKPKPQPTSDQAPLHVEVKGFDLHNGAVDHRNLVASPPSHVAVSGINMTSQAEVTWPGGPIAIKVSGHAKAQQPVQLPIAFDVSVKPQTLPHHNVNLALMAGGNEVRVHGVAGLDPESPSADLTLERVHITQELIKAFAPTLPLVSPLTLNGSVKGDLTGGSGTLTLRTQGGRIDLQLDAPQVDPPHVKVQLRSSPLNLERIVTGAMASNLQFEMDAESKGTQVETLVGFVKLKLAPGSIAGLATGPISLHARANRGDLTLQSLSVQLPGLDFTAQAQVRGYPAPKAPVEAAAALKLTNLSQTAKALAAIGVATPPLEGLGQLDVSATGTLQALALDVRSHFPRLKAADARALNLTVNAQVPSLQAPWTAEAQLAARVVHAGGRRFVSPQLTIASPEKDIVDVNLGVRGDLLASLSARIRWLVLGEKLRLERLRIQYPGTVWQTSQPAQVAFGKALQVEGLRLLAGAQSVAADVDIEDDKVNAQVAVQSFNIAGLKPLVGNNFPATGTVSVKIDAQGKLPLPGGNVTLELHNAAFGEYGPANATLSAQLQGRRVKGALDAAGAGATINASFNVPTVWPWPARAPADVVINANVPSLSEAAAKLGLRSQGTPSGSLTMQVNFTGRTAKPTLDVQIHGKALKIDDVNVGDLDLSLHDDERHPLTAKLALHNTALAEAVSLEAETAVFTHELLRGSTPQILRAARARPLRVQGNITKLNLQRFTTALNGLEKPRFEPLPQPLQGWLDLDVDITGTPLAPTGNLNVSVSQVQRPGLPPTDGKFSLALTPQKVKTHLEVSQQGRQGSLLSLLRLDGDIAVPRTPLVQKAWMQTALTVDAHVGPMKVQHVQLPQEQLGSLRGQAEAHLSVKGTVEKPTVDLEAWLRDIKADRGGLGNVTLTAKYHDLTPSVNLEVNATAGGSLLLAAQTQAPLPWQEATKPGFAAGTLPIRVQFEARDLSLSAFNGLARDYRDIAGKLQGRFVYTGTFDKPDFDGDLKLSGGEVDIVEVGRFHDMSMALKASEQHVDIDAFRFRSGAGRGRISFHARRAETRGLKLNGDVNLRRFPLQSPQRKLGELSLEAAFKGKANADAIVIDPLEIPDAKVFLEGDSPKDLQDMDVPKDVVLVRNGEPINRDEAKKLARLGPPEQADADDDGETDRVEPQVRPEAMPIKVKFKAPRNLWVHGPDANIEVGLSDDFQVLIQGDTVVFGTVYLRRGTINVFGRRFDVESDSNLRFSGPVDAPTFDVTLEHFNERAQVRVWVAVKGSPEKLDLQFRSDRATLSESDIITLLITGRLSPGDRGGGDSADPTAQAASIVGGLLASKLQRTALRRLPIDFLSVTSSAIEAGTYVTDDLYVGYVRRLAADPWRYQNVNAVHLEYQLSPAWSFEGEYGDAGTGSGDLIWKRRY